MTTKITAAEANRLLYAEIAKQYDENLDLGREQIAREVDEVLALAPRHERVLDACGGSGNVSLALLAQGVSPLLVDVSPDLLDIYRRKAKRLGFEPDVRESTIESFLADDEREWDIIFFVAALHHLDDYAAVLKAAASRLAPGGVLVTSHDPVRVTRVGRWLRILDYFLHLVMQTPRQLPAAVKGRLRRQTAARELGAEMNLGRHAERHAVGGIDDLALASQLRQSGLRLMRHDRQIDSHVALSRALYRLLRQPTSFALIAVRD